MSLPPPVVGPVDTPQGWAPPLAPTVPLTAKDLLFESEASAEAAVDLGDEQATDPRVREALGKLSKVTRKVAHREIRKAILGVLDIDLLGVVQRGWQRHDALLDAGKRTLTGGREVVALAEHTITSTHTPHVALEVNGIDLGKIKITVLLTMKLIGITGVVEGGHLVGIETGAIDATGKLSIEEVPITSRSQSIDAVTALKLAKPIPLVAPPPAPGS